MLTHLNIQPSNLTMFNKPIASLKKTTIWLCCYHSLILQHHTAVTPSASWWVNECWKREMEDRRKTGRVQVSCPIGVRGWRLHLPKQTAQRSRVLHLSLWITPLSHPPVSQCPIPTTHYSIFIQHAQWWVLENVKLQEGSNFQSGVEIDTESRWLYYWVWNNGSGQASCEYDVHSNIRTFLSKMCSNVLQTVLWCDCKIIQTQSQHKFYQIICVSKPWTVKILQLLNPLNQIPLQVNSVHNCWSQKLGLQYNEPTH